MTNRLRQLGPLPLGHGVTPPLPTRAQRLGYKVAVLAVILQFTISPNILGMLGINYDAPGGNPLVKLHPATYVAFIAAWLALCGPRPAGSALSHLFRSSPALALYLVLIPACAFYSIACVGFSGSAVYIDTYLSAGMITLALQHGTDLQHRFLARLIIAWCVLNVFISVGESLTQTHLIPQPKFAEVIPTDQDDFRGAALFGHPLTGSLVTALTIFLLLGIRLGAFAKSVLFATFLIGLLAYGGRAAMGTTLFLLLGGAAFAVCRGLLYRRLSGGLVAALLAAVFLLLPLLIVVITGTSIGDRLMTHLYADDSADVRSIQWMVLDRLNTHDVLFGVTPTRLNMMKYEIGLGASDTDIENFWLLMFLDLGIIGFVVWAIALGLFLWHLGRRVASPYGWLMMLAFVMIDSSANSLGRKCADLVFLSALMISLSGYRQAQQAAAPAARLVLHRFARRRLPAGASGKRALSRALLSRNPSAPMAGMKS